MNKLYLLLKDFCPNGVEYQELAHAVSIERGKRVVREQLDETGLYPVYQNSLTPLGYHSQWNYPAETTFLIVAGAAGEIGYSTCNFWAADDCFPLVCGENLSSRYLYHVMLWLQPTILSRVRKASIPRLSRDSIERLTIPLPPLEVQHEIVRILDTFTELTSELTENLSMELTARKQQYEYYRNKLLDKQQSSTKIITIGELGAWSGGKTPSMDNSDYWENGTIPWISSKDMKASTLEDTEDHITEQAVNESAMTVYPANGIAVVTRSGILKHTLPVAFVPFETTVNQDIKMLTVYEGVLPRYAFHAIQGKSPDILTKAKKQGGTVDSLEFKKFLDYKIPLPSLAVQKRLVEVLDNFDAICSDLNIGLPAEIEARKKQYEFYRDQLLTFAAQDEIVLTDRQTDEYNALIRLCQYVFGYVSIELGSIGKVSMCKRIMKAETAPNGDVPFYKIGTFGKTPDAYISREKFEEYRKAYSFPKKGDVLISAAGTIGRTVIYDGEDAYYQDSNIVWVDNDESIVLNRYLFYCYQLQPWAVSEGGTIARLYNDNISKAKIKVPSIAEQKRIIAILDHFSTLCTDLTSALPAEIEARKKQYEYYRDNLLSFTTAD